MVFSWIFPVCLRGTMLSSLLLLLSLVSVESFRLTIERKDFKTMVNETLDKEIVDSLPYGCRCTISPRDQIPHEIERCCRLQDCCHKELFKYTCKPKRQRYTYTYRNGTLTCKAAVIGGLSSVLLLHTLYIEAAVISANKEFLDNCAPDTCECDRKTVMCLMGKDVSEQYSQCINNKPSHMSGQPCYSPSMIALQKFFYRGSRK
ncbi:basic phospholipase A2 homolog LmutTX-like isoform 1-T1 [Anomaloglossus baeobatrachus]|uniref:basic phospholipase A2 homolog LmutTX-like isoform X1 n=1 Tax=Anomaloglossus baeobatrachus TaxID=238106 RepID=UPI003F4F7EBB